MDNIQFKIRKKKFKDALAIAKRTIPKKDGSVVMMGKGNEILFYSKGEKLDVFDYVELQNETMPFVIKFDPAPVDKWLDKSDRDLDFEIVFETIFNKKKKENESKVFLHSIEKNKRIEVFFSHDIERAFVDVRNNEYQPYNNKEEYLEILADANKCFQNSDRSYASYAKVTDINLFVFDPLFFSVFMFDEATNIMNAHGNEGIAIHKDAIDVIVKTVKKPKDFTHYLSNEAMYIKEENTVFYIKFSKDIRFPDYRSIKPNQSKEKQVFEIDADQVNDILKGYPKSKVKKIVLECNIEGEVTIIPDNEEFDAVTFENDDIIPRSVFTNVPLKSFFEGITGKLQVSYVNYQSKTTKKDQDNYFWIYKNKNKSKIMPGIISASGFKQN